MDNDTMVEAFKFFNYCELAKNSLISKKFRDLICTNRHHLALLYVKYIGMRTASTSLLLTRAFDQKLSPEAYNEWVSSNQYSKQIPIEGQIIGKKSAQYRLIVYEFCANADYNGNTNVLYARIKLSHENWPVFQHFVRLLTDPFIYVRDIKLIP